MGAGGQEQPDMAEYPFDAQFWDILFDRNNVAEGTGAFYGRACYFFSSRRQFRTWARKIIQDDFE